MLKSKASEQNVDVHLTDVVSSCKFEPATSHVADDDAVVTEFLSAVERRLAMIPAEKRAEIARELRQHINAMIDARMEPGEDRAIATAAALRQFGDAERLSRRLRSAWLVPTTRMQREIRYAAARAGALGLVVSFVSIAITVAHVRLCFRNPEVFNVGTYLLSPVMSVFQILVPIFAGRLAILQLSQSRATGLRLWSSVLLQIIIASILEKIMYDVVWTAGIGSNRFVLTHIAGYFEGMWTYALPAGILSAIFTLQRRQPTQRRGASAFALLAMSGWIAIGMARTIELFGAGPVSAIGLGDAARWFFPGLLAVALLAIRSSLATGRRCKSGPLSIN